MKYGTVNRHGEFYGRFELEEDDSGFCKLIIRKPTKRSRAIPSDDNGRKYIIEDTEDLEEMHGIKGMLMQQLQRLSLELEED